MEIITKLLAKIKETDGKAVIDVSPTEARELYDHLNEYHRVKLPAYDEWIKTMVFYGYRLKIYDKV